MIREVLSCILCNRRSAKEVMERYPILTLEYGSREMNDLLYEEHGETDVEIAKTI